MKTFLTDEKRNLFVRLCLLLRWLALVYWLPAKAGNVVAAVGIFLYILRVSCQDHERPKWGTFLLQPSVKIEIKEHVYLPDEALARGLLTQIQTEDAASITKKQWEFVYKVLYQRRRYPSHKWADEEVIVGYLQVVRQHAATADLPYLSFWVDTIASLWANETGPIAEAAQECVPILNARLQQESEE
jgi:hypothetical protein